MAYKYVDPEKLEKRKRRSTKTSGVFSILIGILCLALGVVFFVALKSLGGMLFCLFFTLVFVGAGVYFFNQIKLEEKRFRELDDPNSRAYKKRQRTLEKKREKYVRKAEHHGSMKRTLSHRPALIWGVTTVFVWSLSLLLLAWGIIIFILPVLDVMCPIAFVASLFGKNYRTVLAAYKRNDLEKREAEQDFAASKVYLISTNTIAVSSRFLTVTAIPAVLPMDEIVWVYSGYDNLQKYSNGEYSHTKRVYSVIVALANSEQYKIQCPEELCSVIISDVTKAGNLVTVGYSRELQVLYNTNPDAFRSTVKHPGIVHMEPVGPEMYNSEHIWDGSA